MNIIRQVARRLLTMELGPRNTPDELATAVVRVFTTLLASLSPLLGHTGSAALFRRSISLTEATVPLYREVRGAKQDQLLDAVDACLRQQPADVAREASEALFTAYVELLANVIGERLTTQLLQEAWPDLLAPSPKESDE